MPGDLRPERTSESDLRFSVLGSFRVDLDGKEVDLGPRLHRPGRLDLARKPTSH